MPSTRAFTRLFVIIAAMALVLPAAVPPPARAVDTITLAATADAYLNEARPTSNYGPASTLRVRASTDDYASLVQFTVAGLSAAPESATLRLFVIDDSPSGGRVSTAANTWTETGVTWSTQPALGTALGNLPPAVEGTWLTLDVTSAIGGNGTYSFHIAGLSGNSAVYSSRQGAQPPQLVVTTASGGTTPPPPPPPPTASFSATPTSGDAPLTVAFTDTSTGAPTSWAWDFDNDGDTDSTARHPSHTYTGAGTYSVELTVTNAGGSNSLTRTDLIRVSSPTTSPPGGAVLVGAADIAKCNSTNDEATAALIDAIPGTVFTAGDNTEAGTATQFSTCYEPSWGRFKSRTRPAAGNHEYDVSGASAYYAYFGAAAGSPGKGWYSYDVGAWHVVTLNSNCSSVGGCGAGSAQEQWLRADLAAHPTQCTMAIFHHPLYTSSRVTGTSSVRPLWQALMDHDAEVVVNGHAHIYERMAPQTPTGVRDDANGIRQFIAGTGGHQLHGLHATIHPNSEVRNNVTHGALKFTLRSDGYDWQFIPVPGKTFTDSGSDTCH